MAKNHLARLAAPKTWNIQRKGIQFVTKSDAGPHSITHSVPLNTLLKEILDYAGTTREAKKILNAGQTKIDGKIRKNSRFPIGIFDTIEFTNINENFRLIVNKKGKLVLIRIKSEETGIKPCKIIGKTAVGGKIQLNLYDGKNIIVSNSSYRVGDSLLLSLPDQKITKHIKLDKKSTIFLIGGKHIGETGHVEDIVENKIIYKDKNGNMVETLKKYAFVVGENKTLITLE